MHLSLFVLRKITKQYNLFKGGSKIFCRDAGEDEWECQRPQHYKMFFVVVVFMVFIPF